MWWTLCHTLGIHCCAKHNTQSQALLLTSGGEDGVVRHCEVNARIREPQCCRKQLEEPNQALRIRRRLLEEIKVGTEQISMAYKCCVLLHPMVQGRPTAILSLLSLPHGTSKIFSFFPFICHNHLPLCCSTLWVPL